MRYRQTSSPEPSWPAGSSALPGPHAQGYTLQGQSSDEPVDATNWSPSAEWTAGELISTVDDLLVYGRATATSDGLLPPEQQRERLHSFNPKLPPGSPKLSYGIGLVNDNGWIGHTGEVPGFTTTVYHHPDIFDAAGHYSRLDLFTLTVDTRVKNPVDWRTKPDPHPHDDLVLDER